MSTLSNGPGTRKRYELVLTSTTNSHLHAVLTIYAVDQGHAEGKATRQLRLRRFASYYGNDWDRWAVRKTVSPHCPPIVVAYGDNNGTRWSLSPRQASIVRRIHV